MSSSEFGENLAPYCDMQFLGMTSLFLSLIVQDTV